MLRYEIGKNDAGMRMDKLIQKLMPTLPKSLMYKYIRMKKIKLNGKRTDISFKPQVGDVIEAYIPDEFGAKVEPKYVLLGGVIGAGITWLVIKSVEMLGPAKSALLIVTAQLLVSYLIELFGLFGMDKEPFEWRKLLGLGVAVVGITIFQWK